MLQALSAFTSMLQANCLIIIHLSGAVARRPVAAMASRRRHKHGLSIPTYLPAPCPRMRPSRTVNRTHVRPYY